MPRPPGWKWSEEVKAKMRASSLKAWTPVRRRKASRRLKEAFRTGKLTPPHTGHAQTDYQKQKAAEANRGKVVREETKKRLRRGWASLTSEQVHERTLPGILARCKTMSGRSQAEKLVKGCLYRLKIRYRSQKPFLTYIVDLYLPEHNLVIECDGDGHDRTAHRKKDQKRDRLLTKQFGIRTIRIKNRDILADPMEATRKALRKAGLALGEKVHD